MPKITVEQAVELLNAAGVQAVEVVSNKADADADFSVDTHLSAIDESRSAVLKPKIYSEERDRMLAETTSRSKGQIDKLLAAEFNLEKSKLAELSIEDKIKMVKSTIDGNSSKDTVELRKQMDTMIAEHNAALEALEATRDKEVGEWKEKYIGRDKEAIIRQYIEASPLLDTANKDMLTKQALAYLSDSANVVYDEATKSLSLRDKANSELPIFNDNKTKQITAQDKTQQFLKDLGIWQENTANIKPDGSKGKEYQAKNPNAAEGQYDPRNKDAFNQGLLAKLDGVPMPEVQGMQSR